MAALEGHVEVPFDFEDVDARWRTVGTLEALSAREQAEMQARRLGRDDEQPWLPPPHLAEGPAGVRDDLVRLGVFRPMRSGRIDVPDVYRLGFGLARRGGVPLVGNRR